MYIDTRVRDIAQKLVCETRTLTEYIDGTVRSDTGWVNVNTLNYTLKNPQSITSVRGPRLRGRFVHTNPVSMTRTIHDTGRQQMIAAPPQFLTQYNPTRVVRLFVRGDVDAYILRTEGKNIWSKALSAPALYDKDREYAIQKAYAKANAAISNLMVSLAELRETARMLISPLYGLRKFLVKLLTRTNRHRKSNFSEVAKDAWLEYRYGIMPLILDVSSISQAIHAKASEVYKFDATVRRRDNVTKSFATLNSGAGYVTTYEIEESRLYKTSAGLYTNPVTLDRFGISASQVLPTILELIPWSFVWNWFIDLDTWVNALCASTYIHPKSGYVSFKSSNQVKVTPVSWFSTVGLVASSPPGDPVIRTTESLVRSTNLGVDLSTVHFNNAFTTSWRRMTDAVALLWKRPTSVMKILKGK